MAAPSHVAGVRDFRNGVFLEGHLARAAIREKGVHAVHGERDYGGDDQKRCGELSFILARGGYNGGAARLGKRRGRCGCGGTERQRVRLRLCAGLRGGGCG